MINDPLLNPYIQRLDELPFIIQRHLTQLKDSPPIPLEETSSSISTENLLQAISASARKLQITNDLAGQLQMAVYGLDNSLRDLVENVSGENIRGGSVSGLSAVKKSLSKQQQLQRITGNGSRKDLSNKRFTRSITGKQKLSTSSSSKRSSKRSQSSSRKKSKRINSSNKKRTSRHHNRGEEEEEPEEPVQDVTIEEGEELEEPVQIVSNEEEHEGTSSRRSPEDADLPEITCLCEKAPYGEMVGCDNPNCPIEWFHLECVGLDKPPTETTWLCPQCSK